jgi:large subunit ribosomal protein L15
LDSSKLSTPEGSHKGRNRVGRGPGSGNGKTSGRGHKGQKARAGYSRKGGFEGGQMPLNRRLPKRGFNHAKRLPFFAVNLDMLEQHFEANDEVDMERLLALGRSHEAKGGVKVLARGELTKPLKLKVQAISGAARQKVEAAGGTVEIVPAPKAAVEQAVAKADENSPS